MACDPNELMLAAKGFVGLSPKTLKAMFVRLLCAARDGETMACDPEALQEEAACLMCLSEQQLDAIAIWLMCQLASDLAP